MQKHPIPHLDLVTPQQLAERLQVSLRTVTNWKARHIIPFIKIGKVVRFSVGNVLSALEAFERKAVR
jgi:excisionase family DNA binding protein